VQSDNGSITDGHALRQWSSSYLRSLEGIKDLRAPMRMSTMMTAAGMEEVDMKMIPLPLSGWSSSMFPFRPPYPPSQANTLAILHGQNTGVTDTVKVRATGVSAREIEATFMPYSAH
jgi:hypothetical protein